MEDKDKKYTEDTSENINKNVDTNQMDADNTKNSGRKREKAWRIMDFIVPIVCLTIFVIGAVQVYRIRTNYNVAVEEYDALKEYVSEKADGSEKVDMAVAEDNNGAKEHFLQLDIDFETLKAINDDVVGWLYLPCLDMSYPVVQGPDNDYYLKHTYEDTANSSGSIFLDSESAVDMTDRNTFIYGHNMRNGSMFGSMKKLRAEQSIVDGNPYVYYYTQDHAYKYKIFAFYIAQVGGEAYFNFMTDAQYDAYMDKALSKNEYVNVDKQDLASRKNILTLSTCSGAHSKNRMVTHCVLVDDFRVEMKE